MKRHWSYLFVMGGLLVALVCGQAPAATESSSVTVTVPQLSVPVATPLEALDSSSVHSIVTSIGHVIMGAVVSTMVNVAEVAAVRPHSSDVVKVTADDPVAPQPSERLEKSLPHETSPQTSLAVAAP